MRFWRAMASTIQPCGSSPQIVRGADTIAPRTDAAVGRPVRAVAGLSRNFGDDHEMLKHGMVMYDALYAWCRECQGETHNWPPKMN